MKEGLLKMDGERCRKQLLHLLFHIPKIVKRVGVVGLSLITLTIIAKSLTPIFGGWEVGDGKIEVK